MWRALDELTPAALRRVEKARARVRRHVWAQLAAGGGLPASRVAGTDLGETVVLDVDATLVTVHSEKESAAATFKGGFGYHPIGVWCDNTQEMLAAMLRPGNAGSNTTADHIAVLTAAIAQVPAAHRKRLLVRADGAGASHGLLDWLTAQDAKRGRSVEYSVGFAVTDQVRTAISRVPAQGVDAGGRRRRRVRDGGDVAEVTDLLDLTRLAGRDAGHHPPGTTPPRRPAVPVRGGRRVALPGRSPPTPPVGQLAFLEARHRAHARVEDRIRHAKDSGLGRFPSREFAINQAWLQVVTLAADLTAWLRLLALPDDPQDVRAEGAALPAAARPRPPHPRRPTTTAAAARDLAVGRRRSRPSSTPITAHPRPDLSTGHRP